LVFAIKNLEFYADSKLVTECSRRGQTIKLNLAKPLPMKNIFSFHFGLILLLANTVYLHFLTMHKKISFLNTQCDLFKE
jgi:hypothetical protein